METEVLGFLTQVGGCIILSVIIWGSISVIEHRKRDKKEKDIRSVLKIMEVNQQRQHQAIIAEAKETMKADDSLNHSKVC